MNNPLLLSVSEWTWTKAASEITIGTFHEIDPTFKYYYTYRIAGDDAPPDLTSEVLPKEAVRLFGDSKKIRFLYEEPIDIYVLCVDSEVGSSDIGKIRFDLERIDINPNLLSVLSSSRDAVVTTSYADEFISKGFAQQIHRIIQIPSSSTVTVVLDFSTIIDKIVFTLPIIAKTNLGQCYLETYKILNYTGGTIIPSTNRSNVNSIPADCVIKSGITTSDIAGDDLRQYIVGQLTAFLNSGGGPIGGGHPKIFSGGSIIAFSIINKETQIVDFELNINWYEVPLTLI